MKPEPIDTPVFDALLLSKFITSVYKQPYFALRGYKHEGWFGHYTYTETQ